MNCLETSLSGVKIFESSIFLDTRGYFAETFRQNFIEESLGYPIPFVQENESFSQKNTLRGLHYQLPPFAQSKLVRVTQGRVLDVAVDIRKTSETFGEYVAVELSAENKKQLFIPRGFAHGFLVLSETATFSYKVDNYYAPEYDRGILFSDRNIGEGGIDWGIPISQCVLSEKDQKQVLLSDAEVFESEL